MLVIVMPRTTGREEKQLPVWDVRSSSPNDKAKSLGDMGSLAKQLAF